MERKDDLVNYKLYNLIKHDWDRKYINSARQYPSVKELAERIVLDIDGFSNELIDSCFENLTEVNARKLNTILGALSRKKDERSKGIALKCAKTREYPFLKKLLFKLWQL